MDEWNAVSTDTDIAPLIECEHYNITQLLNGRLGDYKFGRKEGEHCNLQLRLIVFYRFARLYASPEQTLHSTRRNSTLRTYKPKNPLQIKNYTTIDIRLKIGTFTTLAVDLLNPSIESEKSKHKLKRLVQSPNSYFMDVKCPGCFNITTVFSHAQTVVLCSSCATVLCQPTGGRARLTEGCSFRRKLN
ncbi:unnamed protein product [Umbelopsis vinacea]